MVVTVVLGVLRLDLAAKPAMGPQRWHGLVVEDVAETDGAC